MADTSTRYRTVWATVPNMTDRVRDLFRVLQSAISTGNLNDAEVVTSELARLGVVLRSDPHMKQ